MEKIKIVIVDDHQLFREGLSSLLSSFSDQYELLDSFEDGSSFFTWLSDGQNPDIVLLDLSMPKMDGFEVIARLMKANSQVKIIVLSMYEDGNYILKAARSGAHGYLPKNVNTEELRKAIDTVLDGKKYFSSDISQKMFETISLKGSFPDKLTPKESQILQLIAAGQTTKEMADALYVSTRTIETHRMNMMKKLKVKNSPELIKKATKLDLIQ